MSMTAIASSSKSTNSVMFWSRDHGILLCREVLLINPYKTKSAKLFMEKTSVSLNAISEVKFQVDKRSVRDHVGVLINRYKRKIRAEEKASGISPDEPNEFDTMLEEIIGLEESSDMEQHELNDDKREKAEQDKGKAEDMRCKAMEKLSETSKRKSIEKDKTEKKQRRGGSDTLMYLTEKAERDKQVKLEELKMTKDQQQLQMGFLKQQTDAMKLLQQEQQQQKHNQQQLMNYQMLMMQQQQEQTKALVGLLEKL